MAEELPQHTSVPARRPAVHVVIVIILAPMLAGLIWLRHERLTKPTIFIENGALVVKTRSREVYPIAEMTAMSLEARIPEGLSKEEGLARGGRLSGRFTLPGAGSGRVVANTGVAPYLFVRTAGGFLLLNFPEPAETRALYEQLRREWRELAPFPALAP